MTSGGTPERKMVTVYSGFCCCTKKTEEDAIEHYSANIEQLKSKINIDLEIESRRNQGIAFVVFRSRKLVNILRKPEFLR